MKIICFVSGQPGLRTTIPCFPQMPALAPLFLTHKFPDLHFYFLDCISRLVSFQFSSMEFRFRAGDDRHARFPAQARQAGYSVPNLGRPGQLQNPMIPSRGALPREMEKERIREEIIASEILLRKRELEEEVRRDLAYEREVALRRQSEQFSLQAGMKHKAQGEGLVIAMKPGGSNDKASASSYPPPHKPYRPQMPAKQVSGGGVTANLQHSKPHNIVGVQHILHGEHCKVKCNSVPHLMGGKKQHVPMQVHKASANKGNGKGGADVKVRVVVQVKPGKNRVVASSGTAARAQKPNKPGGNGNGNNKAKGKPQVGAQKPNKPGGNGNGNNKAKGKPQVGVKK